MPSEPSVSSSRSWHGLATLVTGASGGIGEELAVQLAASGARVALTARRREKLERVAERCRRARTEAGVRGAASSGGSGASGASSAAGDQQADPFFVVPADVTDRAQCESLVAAAVSRFGGLDVLVNNVGQGMWGRADEMTDWSVYEEMLRVNYLSAVWLTLSALPHLKQRRGRVLSVGSLSGKTGVPLRSGYSAAKHALTGFMDTLRIELDGTGVSVTMIHPGWVGTGSQARNLGVDGRLLGEMPVKPMGGLTPADCAALLLAGGAARRRDVFPDLRSRLALWLKLIRPEIVDRMTAKAIRGRR